MSLIPEYKKTAKRESKPTGHGLRLAAGITSLITGILLGISFMFISLSDFISAGISLDELMSTIGGNAPIALYILVFDYFIIAFTVFLLSIYIIIIGIKSIKGGIGRTLRSATITWSLLLLIYVLLLIISYIGLPSEYKTGLSLPILPVTLTILAFLLILVGAVLVNVGVSFSRFFSGAFLLLVGVILLLVSSLINNGIAKMIDSMIFLPPQLAKVDHISDVHELVLFVNPAIVISLLVGAIAILIAPFIGTRNLWIIPLIGAVSFIYGMIIFLYYSVYAVTPIWDTWSTVKGLSLLGYPHPLAIKTIILLYVISIIMLLLGAVTGIVAGLLTIVYVASKGSNLFPTNTPRAEEQEEGVEIIEINEEALNKSEKENVPEDTK